VSPDLCSVRWLMRDVRDAMANILDCRTLADALRHRQASGALPASYEI
jgi:DNA-binding IscR family transcriptional regulator